MIRMLTSAAVYLVANAIGLLVAAAVLDSALTWVLATVIVWAAGLVAGLVLPALFLKRAATDTRGT